MAADCGGAGRAEPAGFSLAEGVSPRWCSVLVEHRSTHLFGKSGTKSGPAVRLIVEVLLAAEYVSRAWTQPRPPSSQEIVRRLVAVLRRVAFVLEQNADHTRQLRDHADGEEPPAEDDAQHQGR